MLMGSGSGFNPPLLLKFVRAAHLQPTARTGFVVQLLQRPEPAVDSQLCSGKSERPGPSLPPQITSTHLATSPSSSPHSPENPLQPKCARALSG